MAIDVSAVNSSMRTSLSEAMSNAFGHTAADYLPFAIVIADEVSSVILQHIKDNAVAKSGVAGPDDLSIE